MKHRGIRILLSAIVALGTTSLTGCGSDRSGNSMDNNTKPAAVVIIAGRHANAKMYSEKMIDDALEFIEQSYVIKRESDKYVGTANIFVIVSDGDPEEVPVELNGENILSYTSNNAENIRESKKKLASNVKQFLLSPELKANDNDVDLLLSLTRAQSKLNQYPDYEHHILILDTGITTCGYLDMVGSVDVFSTDNADIIKQIKPGIPDFHGTQITFYGLGNVAFPQSTIKNNDSRKKIEQLWTDIIKEGGGTLTNTLYYNDVEITEAMFYSEDEGENIYPNVSSVAIPSDIQPQKTFPPMNNPDGTQVTETEVEDNDGFWGFQMSDLGFKPDSTEFLRKEVARNSLGCVAPEIEERLNRENAPTLYIVGSIAKTSPDSNSPTSKVSQGRAEAVRDLLINDFGVNSERVKVVDAGTTIFPWRDADEFPNGVYDPIAAQKNRVVAIISSDAPWFEKLKETGYVD